MHVGYHAGHCRAGLSSRNAELIGDVGAEPRRCSPIGSKASCRTRSALLPLREDILARIADRADEAAFRRRRSASSTTCAQVMPEDGIVALDNGMYKIWFARNYRTHVANTLLLDNALATMGAGLPSAMMAALLYPERRVLAVCGDGGFMMNSQELETAVRLRLNLVVLILEDDAYGMIRWKQAVDGFPDFGLTFGNPDFVAYAEAYGAKGIAGRDGGRISCRRWRRRSTPAACIWSSCRSTTPRTSACWSTSCAPGSSRPNSLRHDLRMFRPESSSAGQSKNY